MVAFGETALNRVSSISKGIHGQKSSTYLVDRKNNVNVTVSVMKTTHLALKGLLEIKLPIKSPHELEAHAGFKSYLLLSLRAI